MGSIGFGGDAESFMDAPVMENKALTDSLGGGSIIAQLLDLVGIHRQVAKAPKQDDDNAAKTPTAVPESAAVVPAVLTDVASALASTPSPMTPIDQNSPMTTWGQKWLDSMRPIQTIDPGASSAFTM